MPRGCRKSPLNFMGSGVKNCSISDKQKARAMWGNGTCGYQYPEGPLFFLPVWMIPNSEEEAEDLKSLLNLKNS
jgi:hypothetical protein